jgi:hypothetical protein
MPIEQHIGAVMDEPIRNGAVSDGELRRIWDAPVKLREKNQIRALPGGRTLNFTLLRYIPGLVTYCSVGPNPVFTGYMSGCFLFRFRQGGKLYAAHVGTDDTNQEKNAKVKAVWSAFADRPDVTDVMGCNPALELSPSLLAQLRTSGRAAQIAGYWEPNGAMRTLVMAEIRGQIGKKEIFASDYSALRPWSVLRSLPKFAVPARV